MHDDWTSPWTITNIFIYIIMEVQNNVILILTNNLMHIHSFYVYFYNASDKRWSSLKTHLDFHSVFVLVHCL